jgi:amino acid transporter
VTAIEAKDPPGSLKWPAKSVAAILFVAYLLSVLGFYLNVSWQDSSLPSMATRTSHQTLSGSSILIIAVNNSQIAGLPGFLNAALLLTVFSAANTTIYVASRTLFGLARSLDSSDGVMSRIFSHLGTTSPLTSVPAWAVMASAASFIWLPWLHAGLNYSDQSVSLSSSLFIFLSAYARLTWRSVTANF